jgi:hypothetical protein
MKKTYILVNGEMVDKAEHFAKQAEANAPYVIGEIQPYQSMITGEMIDGRAAHRAHLKAHGVIEVGNETQALKPRPITPPAGRKEILARVAYEKLRY